MPRNRNLTSFNFFHSHNEKYLHGKETWAHFFTAGKKRLDKNNLRTL